MSGSTPADVLTLTTDPADLDRLLGGYTGDLVVDTFAGPGGWTAGIVDLLDGSALREVALEWDAAACLTRVANGLPDVLRCDVAAFPASAFHGRRVRGFIGSPPCQTFSAAGGKSGAAHLTMLAKAAHDVLAGTRTLDQATVDLAAAGALTDPKTGKPDPRNGLILQPARWLRELGAADPDSPLEWAALEQVPTVRLVFEAYALALKALGWRTAHVVTLNAADYGVPQTRERVFLIAHRTRVVEVPAPSHARGGEGPSMFGPGRLAWVSMARALGWGMTARPYLTLATSRTTGGPDPSGLGAFGARAQRDTERDEGRWVEQDDVISTGARTQTGHGLEQYERPVAEPSPTVDTKAGGAWAIHRRGERDAALVDRRRVDPGKGYLDQRWEPGSEEAGRFLLNRRAGKAGPDGDYPYDAPKVDVGVEPCPTVTAASFGHGVFTIEDRLAGNPDVGEHGQWAEDRPATVVASREIVQHPGATANRHNDSAKTRNDGLRVTETEGAILQGFPGGYEWAGPTKSKRWEQIGNVVCPPVARRVIAQLLGVADAPPLPWHAYAFLEAAPVAPVEEPPVLRMGTAAHATERGVDEPAPTVVAGSRVNGITWQPAGRVIDRARAAMTRELSDLPDDDGALF